MARRICTMIENNSHKSKHLRELKGTFKTYGHPEKVAEIGMQKVFLKRNCAN